MTTVFLATFLCGSLTLYLGATQMFGLTRHAQAISVSTSDCRAGESVCVRGDTSALEDAVAIQRRLGLDCGTDATLTDVVLFQYSNSTSVTALAFDQALAASSAKRGWVLRYCK